MREFEFGSQAQAERMRFFVKVRMRNFVTQIFVKRGLSVLLVSVAKLGESADIVVDGPVIMKS
jgi:hypothetical protein